jgi:hypothetical protein
MHAISPTTLGGIQRGIRNGDQPFRARAQSRMVQAWRGVGADRSHRSCNVQVN